MKNAIRQGYSKVRVQIQIHKFLYPFTIYRPSASPLPTARLEQHSPSAAIASSLAPIPRQSPPPIAPSFHSQQPIYEPNTLVHLRTAPLLQHHPGSENPAAPRVDDRDRPLRTRDGDAMDGIDWDGHDGMRMDLDRCSDPMLSARLG